VFGELRIVPSADIGDLGPGEGMAAIYQWRWYYSAPAFAPWVVLLGAMVLFKANRHPRVLLILLPLLIVNLLWFAVVRLLHFPSSARMQFGPVIASYTAAIAVLWLCAHKLGNRNRFVTFLLALAVTAGLCFVGIVSYLGWGFPTEAVAGLIVLAVMVLAVLFALVLAGWCCRNRYGPVQFMLYLALWTVAVCLAGTLAFYSIGFIVGEMTVPISTLLLVAVIGGSVIGACIYVINLPYMILALGSPFFRERFYACLRLKSMPSALITQMDKNPQVASFCEEN
jgi:MFS family permease